MTPIYSTVYASAMTRALIVIRLSNLTDETSSPERQRGVCERLCRERGWSVVGVAEDLDVSASTTSPFDRPALKPWLARPDEFDAIVFWRVDRLVRRVTHLSRMIEWSEEHGVTLVSATEAYFDLSTGIGQAIAIMTGVFAQMETDAISERTSQAFAHNWREGKYRGGFPPYGYLPEKNEQGEWRYFPDLENKPFILGLIDRILSGERPNTIVRDLNDRGVPSPEDYFRQWQGNPTKGGKWSNGNLVRALRSPSLLGQVTQRPVVGKKNGRKVYGEPELLRGDDGKPIVRAEPLISRELHERVCKALDEMNGKRSPYKKSEALLLRVIECARCSLPMYKTRGRNHFYYRCSSASYQTSCGNPAPKMEVADEFVTDQLLSDFGDRERTRKVYEPAEDNAAELAEVNAELEDVAGLIGTGPFRAGPGRKRLEDRAEALDARRVELEATPARSAGYRYEPTGETFREYWDRLTNPERNLFLRDNGVRLKWDNKDGANHIEFIIGDLETLLQAVDPSLSLETYQAQQQAEVSENRKSVELD